MQRSDPHRPGYHFTPPEGWLNDPNGLAQWRGQYHLFYQHNPHGPFWGTIHWGHAASADLLRWRDLPIALAPEVLDRPEDGCWSGVLVDDGGTPTLVYTEVRGGAQLPYVAVGTPDLLRWERHPASPVIAGPPPGLEVPGFRDHCIWRADGRWHMIIGSGVSGRGGTCFLYRGESLTAWEYVGPLCFGDPAETGEMWECPDLFPLGDQHILVLSIMPQFDVIYLAGDFDGTQLVPRSRGLIDLSPDFYAPQSFLDEAGRRVMFGWLREARSAEAQRAAGWSGAMSLPRILTPRADGRPGMSPAPEVESLRGAHYARPALDLPPAAYYYLDDLQGDMLELELTLDPGTAAQVGVAVRASPGREEETLVVYDQASGRLLIDRSRASGDATATADVVGGPFSVASGEPLRLRIFVDRSIVEVFADGHACLSARVYPARGDSLGVALFAQGGQARLLGLDAWQLAEVSTRAARGRPSTES